MPRGKQPVDPKIMAALPRVRAFMRANGHSQDDVVRLTRQSQSQVSKFLSGSRVRITPPIRAICQYANISLDDAPETLADHDWLSQTARQVLVDNPEAAQLLARIIDALIPVLSSLRDPSSSMAKEAL